MRSSQPSPHAAATPPLVPPQQARAPTPTNTALQFLQAVDEDRRSQSASPKRQQQQQQQQPYDGAAVTTGRHLSPVHEQHTDDEDAYAHGVAYDFHADHQAQVRRHAEEKEQQKLKSAKKAKKAKQKNYTWSYILAPFNRPAFLNILWVLIAYIACFYNRVHVQVASPRLVELGVLTSDTYGTINSVSYGVQFCSKFISGFITDYFKRPKATFLVAALSATLCTVGMIFWCQPVGIGFLYSAIKFLAAFGRVCLLKIIATWWPKEVMGSMGAIINVAGSLGEVSSRFAASSMMLHLDWKQVWMVLAAIAGALLLPMTFLSMDRPPISFQALRPTLAQYNEMRMTGRPMAVNREDDEELVTEHEHIPGGAPVIEVISDERGALEEIMKAEVEVERSFFRDVALPLVKKPKFYVVLVLAFCSTGLRESLVSWIGFYFQYALGLDSAKATLWSPILHLAIMPSSFVGGLLLDRVSKKRRGLVPVFFLSANLLAMVALFTFTKFYLPQIGAIADNASFFYAIALFMFACFSFSAPNSFLDGVYVVEMAGSEGAAFASGLVGAIGYSGAAASSLLFGKMAKSRDGWCGILSIMLGAAFMSWLGVIVYWQLDLRDIRRAEKASRQNSRASSLRRRDHRPHKIEMAVEMPADQGGLELQKMSESEAKARGISPEAVRGIVLRPDASSGVSGYSSSGVGMASKS